jgi:hypothetical protein
MLLGRIVAALQVVGGQLGEGIQRVLVWGLAQPGGVQKAFNVEHNRNDVCINTSSIGQLQEWLHIGAELNTHTDTVGRATSPSIGDRTSTFSSSFVDIRA